MRLASFPANQEPPANRNDGGLAGSGEESQQEQGGAGL